MEAVIGVHGGVKLYRGAAKAARAYVERDHSQADDYYLADGTGAAERLTATPGAGGSLAALGIRRWALRTAGSSPSR